MKRKIALTAAIVMLLPLWISSQTLDDALRYSKTFYQGTARFNGMSGAFTALGGDISAIGINPAAAGVFRSTEFAVTPMVLFRDLNTNYNGYGNYDSYSGFILGQIGVVTAFGTGNSSGLTNMSLAYTFNRTNNYFRNSIIDGINDDGSMADFWALQANGYRTGELTGAPWMAYEAYLIDTLSGYLDQYASIFSYYGDGSPTYGQQVKRTIDNAGYSNEHTIAFGANISDKIYFGLGFGITSISYSGHYVHRESDEAQNVFDFVNFTYTDHFNAAGSGWNFKVGTILRPVESLRLGFSFTTPTWYTIDEVFYNNLTAFLDNDTPNNSSDDASPVINSDDMGYRYRITTPYHINAGIAYQIGNIGLISADYEFIDYGKARLSEGSDGYNFYDENQDLVTELGSSGTFRIGAEARISGFYLRGGYSYTGSAFQDGTLNENADANGYSGGIGYRHDNFFVDMSMVWLNSYEAYMMYPDDPRSNPLYSSDPVDMYTKDKYLSFTVALKF